MIRSEAFKTFEVKLEETREYISYNKRCDALIKSQKPSDDFTKKKIFEYNSYIVSLYGTFERFLENQLSDYLLDICELLPKYSDLPEKIKINNVKLNIEVLKSLTSPKYQDLTDKKLIRNLNISINDNKSILNIEAFQHHTYNFKQSIINDFFKNIGVNNLSNKLKNFEPLSELLKMDYQNLAHIKDNVCFEIIDDIAQRRNDVAHGVDGIVMLHVTVIKIYTDFIEAYAKTLHNILLDSYLELLFKSLEQTNKVIKVYNNNIVCLEVNNIEIQLSDLLVTEKSTSGESLYIAYQILEIQINKDSYKSITITEPTQIAVRIDANVNQSCYFKILNNTKIKTNSMIINKNCFLKKARRYLQRIHWRK